MKLDFNQIGAFIGKWLAVGVILHFGFKLGGWIEGVLPLGG